MNASELGYGDKAMETWLHVSSVLKWAVVCIGAASVPVLFHTLYRVCTIYRRSQYFIFLMPIICLDLIMLATIIFNVIADSLPFSPGSLVCKSTAFIATVTASQSNWLWVCMYAQRYIYVFYPMTRVKAAGLWGILGDSRRILCLTGIFSIISQLWLIFVMEEVRVRIGNEQVAVYCGSDADLIDPVVFKYLELLEVGTTYAIPFIITIIADFSVIFNSHDSKRFTIVSSETMTNKGFSSSEACASFKIQSEESIKATNLRRRRMIRRCLLIVTVQGLLNFPYYMLQIVSEVLSEPTNPLEQNPFYMYADAFFYLVYLSQFPLKALFVHLLHLDWRSSPAAHTASENLTVAYRQIRPKISADT